MKEIGLTSTAESLAEDVLGHHDGGEVGRGGRHLGEDRGVDHPKTVDPVHGAEAVDHGPLVVRTALGAVEVGCW